MIKKFILIFALVVFCIAGTQFAQTWAKIYGAYGGGGGAIVSIQQTPDGGFIAAGGGRKVRKLDSFGNIEWEKYYGSGGEISSIHLTKDGGFIASGRTSSFGAGKVDWWILKLDSFGNIEWQKTYGGVYNDWNAPSIQQTTDGGFIVAGYTNSFGPNAGYWPNNMWVIKLDADGNIEWEKAYGGDWQDWAESIQQTKDGGYIVAGTTVSFGAGWYDFWVLKLDSSGNIEWQKAYGGEGAEIARSVYQTKDGGYIVAGLTTTFGETAMFDFWVLKLDSSGNIEWAKSFGGPWDDAAKSVQQTSDGGYIVAGYRDWDFDVLLADFWVLKLDANGNIEWQRSYSHNDWANADDDKAYSIQQTRDGGFIVSGYTYIDNYPIFYSYVAMVLKLNRFGAIDPSCATWLDIKHTDAVGVDSPAITTETPAVGVDSSATVLNTFVAPEVTSTTITELCAGSGICSPPSGCLPPSEYSFFPSLKNPPWPIWPEHKYKTDINCDGCVDELIEFSYSFGSFCGDDWHNRDADFNDDNIVDGMDLSIFINDFGKGCFP